MTMKLNHLSSYRGKGHSEGAAKADSRRARQGGQAMMELCLVLPVLLLLLVGVIEFGRAAYFDIEVTDAARAGALYGAQSMADAADQPAITQAVMNNAQDVPPPPTSTITSTVSCTCPDSGTVGTVGDCTGGALGCTPAQVYVTVEVQYPLQTLFQFPGIPSPFNLTGISTMPVRTQ